jgi:predicted nucleic acid-binding protein
MPGASFFIDTNVLLYSHDARDEPKLERSRHWLEALASTRAGRTNLQVLNELTDVLLRKRWFATPQHVFDVADAFALLGSDPVGAQDAQHARILHTRLQYSWWDCLLLASALELGCTHFLSEDLKDGQRIETGGRALTIVDPFAHTPEQILISR